MAAAPEGMAGETRTLVAVATAPALRPVSDIGGTSDGGRLAAGRGEGGVLGQRSSSTSGAKDGDGSHRPTKAQVGAPGDEGFSPFPLLALLLALAGGALLIILRRDRDTDVATVHPVVPPAQVREEPRPEPAKPSARALPDPPWRSAGERPAPAKPRLTHETPSVAHNARRAAGVAASGLASVAIGLLVRARRRR